MSVVRRPATLVERRTSQRQQATVNSSMVQAASIAATVQDEILEQIDAVTGGAGTTIADQQLAIDDLIERVQQLEGV
jgi:hypothetical protein